MSFSIMNTFSLTCQINRQNEYSGMRSGAGVAAKKLHSLGNSLQQIEERCLKIGNFSSEK